MADQSGKVTATGLELMTAGVSLTLDENENGDIELSIDSDENKEESDYKEDEEYLKKELDDMLAEETEEPDIEVEIHEEKDDKEEK